MQLLHFIVVIFRKSEADVFHSKVTVDLSSINNDDEDRLSYAFLSHVQRAQKLDSHVVTLQDFNFKRFTGNIDY